MNAEQLKKKCYNEMRMSDDYEMRMSDAYEASLFLNSHVKSDMY